MPSAPIVLTIAGFDPSSGAGVTADIKTIAAHHCYGTACITALTVQTTQGVREVLPIPAAVVESTLEQLAADLAPAAVRIGMLGAGDTAAAVASYIERFNPPNVVLDPILVSSSGVDLVDKEALEVLRARLLPKALVVTPNLSEAQALTGLPGQTLEQMREAAGRFHHLGVPAVVIKGGHLAGQEAIDLLSISDHEGAYQEEFRGPRLARSATHGMGCAFATALACNLALGHVLADAVSSAKQFVITALARSYALGSGAAPLHHLYSFV
jgi:hydroxymethylpyrimidine/phosphomethylpyrimidine kinase